MRVEGKSFDAHPAPLKEIDELAAKNAAEDLDGEEEGILGMNPARELGSELSAGMTQWR